MGSSSIYQNNYCLRGGRKDTGHAPWMRPQFAGLNEPIVAPGNVLSGLSGNAVWKKELSSDHALPDRRSGRSRRPPIAPSPAAPTPPTPGAQPAQPTPSLGARPPTAARGSAEGRKNVVPRGGSALGSGTSPPPDWLSPRGVSP